MNRYFSTSNSDYRLIYVVVKREESPLFDVEYMEHVYETSHEFRMLCAQNGMYPGMPIIPQGVQPEFHQAVNGPHYGHANAQLVPPIPNVGVTSRQNLSAGQPFIGSQQPININGSNSLPSNSLLFAPLANPLANPPTRNSPSTSRAADNQRPRVRYMGAINTTVGSQPHPIGFCPFPKCSAPIHNSWDIPEHLRETHIHNGVQISSNSSRPYPKTGQFFCEVPGCGSSVIMSKCVAHYRQHIERYFCPAPNCEYHCGTRDLLRRHGKAEHQDNIDAEDVSPVFVI